MHHADGADLVKVRRAGRIDALVALGEDHEHAVALLDVVDQLDGTFASDGQRNDGIRKDDGVANGKNRQFFGNRLNPLADIFNVFEIPFHLSPQLDPTQRTENQHVLESARDRRQSVPVESGAHPLRRPLPRSVGHATGPSASLIYRQRVQCITRTRGNHCHQLFSGGCCLCSLRRSAVRSDRPQESADRRARSLRSCVVFYISRYHTYGADRRSHLDGFRRRNSLNLCSCRLRETTILTSSEDAPWECCPWRTSSRSSSALLLAR